MAAVGLAVRGDHRATASVLGAVFLLSFLHQPLTLPLVYGDPEQRAARRRLLRWSPPVFLVAVLAGLHLSFVLVALVAGLWNAEHTLMQRYGITRIYGRKGGDDAGRVEKAMLVSWLVLALVWVGADPATNAIVERLPLGATNIESLHLLTGLRSWAALLVVPVALVALALSAQWAFGELRRAAAGVANPAKHVYVLATAALFAWVLFVDPLSGLIGYVGAHSIEYFVIVHRSLGHRFVDGSGGALGALMRRRRGRERFLVAYVMAFGLLVYAEHRWASPEVYTVTVLFLGGLHVFYDGFIWKLRRPRDASGLVAPEHRSAQAVPANARA
ncbi:MAG: hypothetical protein ACT4PW_09050 [Acidimicrobiia bacterium]